ncbi:hypothetical protein [Nitrospira defluvii]|uniref:Uncharacterized protein n=1 Tax=Nitrospira defluvii TaxID=330214 RepID=A0ABN7MFE9_9BACT|nr:hypothetical protein [Nitrospira defluvii]CAE6800682.1 conserved hypothetical protein [Nitrospira defluvii]
MSDYEFRCCGNHRRSLVARLFMRERRRTQERYVVKPDGVSTPAGPALRITARHRCRAVRQAMRTRLVKGLLRRLGLPLGLSLGMFL